MVAKTQLGYMLLYGYCTTRRYTFISHSCRLVDLQMLHLLLVVCFCWYFETLRANEYENANK